MDWRKCQQAVRQFGLDGWLIWDFRGRNQIANALLNLNPKPTRAWFCLILAEGEPRWLVPKLELIFFAGVQGSVASYGSRQELVDELRKLLAGSKVLALEYSPKGELPMVSFVDAGTFQLLQSFGIELVSSADLVHWVLGRIDDESLQLHRQAAQKLMQLKDEAFSFIVDALVNGRAVTEWQVQQFLSERMSEEGLTASHPAIVAVMGNSANPHYFPTKEQSAPIGWGDFVLLDIFGKIADNPKAIYADITWCAYTGSTVPPRFAEQFTIVREARDAAVEFLRERIEKGEPVRGCDVDDVARRVVAQYGRAKDFVHRTGHSLGSEVHGWGVNLDNCETCDTRLIVAGTLVTVEPGIYGPEIGTRTEINIAVCEGQIEITTLPLQGEIVPLI